MAIGTITGTDDAGQKGGPLIVDLLSFLGESFYVAGGTIGFQALVRTALGRGSLTVLGVSAMGDCGGFVPVYVKSTDALKVYQGDYPAGSAGALTEVLPTTDLSSTTFNVVVVSK